jgi:hypothetical protein
MDWLAYSFICASAVGTASLFVSIWRRSARAAWFTMLALVVIPTLAWAALLAERELDVASYLNAALLLSLTIVLPAGIGSMLGSFVPVGPRVRIGIAIILMLLIWTPLVFLGMFMGTCPLDPRCDP